MTAPDRRRAVAALAQLTGFEHAVFVHSGTAALELALLSLAARGSRVALPALACWTVAYAIDKVGCAPVFVDIDEAWSMQPPGRVDAVVAIDPWGSAGDWQVAAGAPVRILDATQSPGARVDGRLAAEVFDAAVLSFGTGKPICLDGGGAALFRDGRAAREAGRLMGFGIRRGRWARAVDRYTFCPHLDRPLADVLEREVAALPAHQRAARERREELAAASPLRSNPLPARATPGIQGTLPILVDALRLSAEEVERAALASRQPLRRHPVAPAYLEPAWTGPPPASACPRAEAIGRHLVFLDRVDGALPPLAGVAAFARALADRADQFRLPYPLPEPTGGFEPDRLAYWADNGAVCRAIDGSYWVLDECTSRMRAVSAATAAAIQSVTGPARPDRRGGTRDRAARVA